MIRPAVALQQEESGWLDGVLDRAVPPAPLIGALPGEGIGPEVVECALAVLRAVEQAGGRAVAVEVGGSIGREAERQSGTALPEGVVRFCEDVLGRGGAVLSGPGGGRYVYELRRRLDLYLKISPVQARNALVAASPLRAERLEGLDLLVVRENLGGVYQGRSDELLEADGLRTVRHDFAYAEADVLRFLDAAARLARARRGVLTVVVKDAGLPALSGLWRQCAEKAAAAHGVRGSLVDVDLMAYELVRRPREFDVVAAPNMFGDVLGDLAGVLLGSRGLSFGASFTPAGGAVYQTNHGAAHDIAGANTANPAGQILSLAMLLRESLGLRREARAVEQGLRAVWQSGYGTADVGAAVDRVVGTSEMAELVGAAAAESFAAGVE